MLGIGYLLWRRSGKRGAVGLYSDITVPFAQIEEKLKDVLDREGVAIVTDVVDAAEREIMEMEFRDDLMRLIDTDAVDSCQDVRVRDAYERFVRGGLLSFPDATAKTLQPIPGFILRGCVSAGRFAWRVRRHPRVHAAFAQLFPRGPLVSSIDVTFFQPPSEESVDEYALSAHSDQNGNDTREPDLGGCDVYQGILYVWAAEEGHTTTCVWPKSHRSVWPRMMADATFKDSGVRTPTNDWMLDPIASPTPCSAPACGITLLTRAACGYALPVRRPTATTTPSCGASVMTAYAQSSWRDGKRLTAGFASRQDRSSYGIRELCIQVGRVAGALLRQSASNP